MKLQKETESLEKHGKWYGDACGTAFAMELVGERWSLLIIRSVLIGVHRFDDLQEALGVTRSVLTDRLKRLEAEGVIERRLYHERPARYEYHLSTKGRELWPVIHHLTSSMEPGLPPGTLVIVKPIDPVDVRIGTVITYQLESGKPTVVTHRDCGGHARAGASCDACGAALSTEDLIGAPGPGTDLRRPGSWSRRTADPVPAAASVPNGA